MDAIVAVYEDWGIGANGTQPIVIPEDRKHFRRVTGFGTVIVGRRTVEDFPGGRPLKDRLNIVLTRSGREIDGALTASDAKSVAELASQHEPAFVVGGASVYGALLPYCERVFVTKIYAKPESDVFFSNLDESGEWVLADESEVFESNGIKYAFLRYDRLKRE